MGDPYYTYADVYQSVLFKLISMIIPIIVFIPMLFRKYRSFPIVALSFTTLVYIFLIKGIHPPGGEFLYRFLFKIPFMPAFRAPIHKLGVLLSINYAILFGCGISIIYDILRKKKELIAKATIFFLLFFILVIYSYPLWTGEVIHKGGKVYPSFHVKVPQDYFQVKEFFENESKLYRFYPLPQSPTFNVVYDWEYGYLGADPSFHFFSKPGVYSTVEPVPQLPYVLLQDLQYNEIYKILRLMGVKYLILHRDVNEKLWDIFMNRDISVAYLQKRMAKQKGILLEKSFGKLDFYKVSDEHFLPHIYPSSTSTGVHGGIEILVPVSYTKYLERKPVLLLAEQFNNPQSIVHLLKLPKKTDSLQTANFVFKDSTWQDLTVELSQKLELRDQNSEVRVKEEGNYELWLDCSVIQGDEKMISELEVKFDGKEVPLLIKNLKGGKTSGEIKWKRIGKVYLEKGKYRIKVQNSEIENKKLELFLLRKSEFEKAQKEIQEIINKPGINLSYLFSKSRNNLINRYFYIPRDSEYTIKAKLSPNFVSIKIPGAEGLNLKLGLSEEFKEWSFKPSKVPYNYFISEPGILTLSLYLDGDSEEDEYVQMRREKIKVDLKKHPWFNLTYKVEDPKVQTIEVVLGIDFDEDGVVNEYIRGIYPRRAATKFDKFNYKALAKVKKRFPDKEHYDLVKLELYPHKIWGVDCESLERRGKYKFYIRDLRFCNYTSNDFFKVTDCVLNGNLGEEEEFSKWKVTSNLKDYSCNLQNDNLVVTARFGGEVSKNVTLARSFENLNLKQFPFIDFEYKVDDPLFQNLEVILSLDFDKDGIADKDMFSSLSLDTTFKKFKFNAFEVVKEAYPNEKEYRLLQIKLRLREGRKDFLEFTRKGEYSWDFKNIRIYSTSFVLPVSFAFNKPVFEIGGEKYWFRRKFKNKEDTQNVVFTKKVHLKKGEHSISNLLKEGDNFKAEWIIIEPLTIQCLAEEEPKIVFRKVNPTKYEVKVEGARGPFWLVFSESFHKKWRLYSSQSTIHSSQSFGEIVADYPKLKVKEAKHLMKFTPLDIRYLFRKADIKEHYLINGYANGWYIEPDKSGLGENFTLVLYFWPQSLFYLGLGISGITFIGCIGYLARSWRKKN
jgi:hypothetical protein